MTRRREKAPQATGTRRAAREFVFRVLFEADRGDLPLEAVFARSEGAMLEGDDTFTPLNPDALAFAGELVRGLSEHRAQIDDTLRRTIRGWSFDQMAQTDLNVLRLAAFEMLFTGEPHPPVIESAVRIARKFGGDESGRFVNGVLAGLSRAQNGDAPQQSPRKEGREDSRPAPQLDAEDGKGAEASADAGEVQGPTGS